MTDTPLVYIVDDDAPVRESLAFLVSSLGYDVRPFATAREFLADIDPQRGGCVILDVRLKDMSGLDVHAELGRRHNRLPVIFITGFGDVHMAVQAMKDGAADFITKPFNDQELVDSLQRALADEEQHREAIAEQEKIRARLDTLTAREREILRYIVDGKMNKVIAIELGLSPKTVEAHRARVMEKMQVRSLAELVRHVLITGTDEGFP